jgi:hypothetical protein
LKLLLGWFLGRLEMAWDGVSLQEVIFAVLVARTKIARVPIGVQEIEREVLHKWRISGGYRRIEKVHKPIN